MEVDTMVRNNLPVLIVICNNGSMTGADEVFNPQKHLGFECRYDKIMEAAGGYGEMVDRPENIRTGPGTGRRFRQARRGQRHRQPVCKGPDQDRTGRIPSLGGVRCPRAFV